MIRALTDFMLAKLLVATFKGVGTANGMMEVHVCYSAYPSFYSETLHASIFLVIPLS